MNSINFAPIWQFLIRIYLLSTKTGVFAKVHLDIFINCGIQEQNMMGVAAGLATTGKLVFASSFVMFAARRAFEIIRNSIAYQKLNVKSGQPMPAYQ